MTSLNTATSTVTNATNIAALVTKLSSHKIMTRLYSNRLLQTTTVTIRPFFFSQFRALHGTWIYRMRHCSILEGHRSIAVEGRQLYLGQFTAQQGQQRIYSANVAEQSLLWGRLFITNHSDKTLTGLPPWTSLQWDRVAATLLFNPITPKLKKYILPAL